MFLKAKDVLFCHQPKDIQFALTEEKKKQENINILPIKMYWKQLIIKIVADSQLQIDASLQFYFALLFYPFCVWNVKGWTFFFNQKWKLLK